MKKHQFYSRVGQFGDWISSLTHIVEDIDIDEHASGAPAISFKFKEGVEFANNNSYMIEFSNSRRPQVTFWIDYMQGEEEFTEKVEIEKHTGDLAAGYEETEEELHFVNCCFSALKLCSLASVGLDETMDWI